MKIVAFGPTITSAQANPAATYQRGVLKALHGAGHEIVVCEKQLRGDDVVRDLTESVPYAALRTWQGAGDLDPLWAEAAAADAVVLFGGLNRKAEGALVRATSLDGPALIYWALHPLATLGDVARDDGHPLPEHLPSFDLVLVRGGGATVLERFRSLGAREVISVDNGVDPDVHYRVEPEDDLACDMVFLGNQLEDRDQRVRHFFFHVAGSMPERIFIVAGAGWEVSLIPPNTRRLGFVPPGRHRALNSSARLVLDVHGEAELVNGHIATPRMFEAAAAGACVVTDGWSGVADYFEPEKEILVAERAEQVARLVREIGEDQARKIGEAARRRVLAEHTYEQRIQPLVNALEALPAGSSLRAESREAP